MQGVIRVPKNKNFLIIEKNPKYIQKIKITIK